MNFLNHLLNSFDKKDVISFSKKKKKKKFIEKLLMK